MIRTYRMNIVFAAAALIGAGAAATLSGCAGQNTTSTRVASAMSAERVLVNRDSHGLALQGYDPVAYFTVGEPVTGEPDITSRYMGATYRFAKQSHKDMFEANPAAYTPAFGGYCGYAASINRLSPIDPKFWEIIDGRLVLQHNQKAWDLWHKDVDANYVKANTNWPGLVQKNGSAVKVLVNTDESGVALQGYDPVAYFTQNMPVKGSPEFTAVYDGAMYRFASMENRVTFENDPARYTPSFGGYCGYAASINKISPIDPTIFQIIDNRLVLQHTPEAYRLFNKAPETSLKRADRNWPGLVERRGS